MNKLLLFVAVCTLAACGEKVKEVTVQGTPGANGRDGVDGSNGYSIVAKTVQILKFAVM